MKAGDLVRIKRASIGIPKGSLALVEVKLKYIGSTPEALWQVYLLQAGMHRRYLSRDLEVLNASR